MRPLLAALLLATSCALAETSFPTTTAPVPPNEVRVQRMDMGNAVSTTISMTSFGETTVVTKNAATPSMHSLFGVLPGEGNEQVRRDMILVGDVPSSSIISTHASGTPDYRMQVYEPDGSLRGVALRKYHSGKMEQTASDAAGKPLTPEQAMDLFTLKPPQSVDLDKVTLLKPPIDGDAPIASPLPQGPNEIRAEYYDFGKHILQAIYTPDLRLDSYLGKDSKALEFYTVTATLTDNDNERVTQSFLIKKNIITCSQSWRIDKKTNEITESCYTPGGKLLYTRHTIPGKSETIIDSAGNTINRHRGVQLIESPNPDQIDIAKVPVQDMTNHGKAPASAPTPQAE
ncbi:hypothetical protein DB345_03435 [Spartobacteria bacterium LR76]|nr:hypothetical protein DB345_03435 [Spartobacteria bacterium LR76]